MTDLHINLRQRWCVAQTFWDSSGVMCVYGPFSTEEDATAAIPEVENIVDGRGHLAVAPFWGVTSV